MKQVYKEYRVRFCQKGDINELISTCAITAHENKVTNVSN